MGVKDLWAFLSPIYEKKSLWELQGQTVAIDLSCWICDSQTQSSAVLRPHLRNLFFRTSCLLMLGVRPIFVLEGEAPDIKQQEIKRRIQATGKGDGADVGKKVKRSRLKSMISQCLKLLEALGVESIQSPGEGEAMCAQLNAASIVDGCISQDSDCFLYGAKVVYRNFSSASGSKGGSSGFAVDMYDMRLIQDRLGLDREALVALALISGCDYQSGSHGGNRGVSGIGMEKASSLVLTLSKLSGGVLSRLKSWRTDPYFSKLEDEVATVESGTVCILCGHRGNLGRHDRVGCKTCGQESGCKVNNPVTNKNSLLNMSSEQRTALMTELSVRRKALTNPDFPSQSIIDEFLDSEPSAAHLKLRGISWAQPNLLSFLDFAETYLGWPQEYSLTKILPLLTRWKIIEGKGALKKLHPHDVIPESIKKIRVSKGIRCFEVMWKISPGILETIEFTSLEPCVLFEEAYPSMAEDFLDKKKKKGKENRAPKCGTGKKNVKNTQKSKPDKGTCTCSAVERKKTGHICQYLIPKCDEGATKLSDLPSDVNHVTELLENLDMKDFDSSFSDYDDKSGLDDEFDPLELSAIVKSIVGATPVPLKGREKSDNIQDLGGEVERYKTDSNTIFRHKKELDSSSSLSDDEFDDMSAPFHLRVKSRLERDNSRRLAVNLEDDMDALCNHLEIADLNNVGAADESNEHNRILSLKPKNLNLKGHLPEPTFDLGMSALLQSPTNCTVNKTVENASP